MQVSSVLSNGRLICLVAIFVVPTLLSLARTCTYTNSYIYLLYGCWDICTTMLSLHLHTYVYITLIPTVDHRLPRNSLICLQSSSKILAKISRLFARPSVSICIFEKYLVYYFLLIFIVFFKSTYFQLNVLLLNLCFIP